MVGGRTGVDPRSVATWETCSFFMSQDASLSASGHLFFASAIAFYLNESHRLRAPCLCMLTGVVLTSMPLSNGC